MDIIILVIITGIFLLISIYKDIDDNMLALAYIILVSILAASRNILVPDTMGYINIYQELGFNILFELEKTYMESGFVILTILLKILFGSNYQIYFFAIALINIGLINKAILNIFEILKEEKDINQVYLKNIYPLSIYMLTFGFSYMYITLRAGLGYSLALLAFSYVKKSRLKAILIFLLSITFHNSVLILTVMIILLVSRIKFNKKIVDIWQISLIPALLLGYQNYLSNTFLYLARNISMIALRFHSYINEDIIVDQKGAIYRVLVLIILSLFISRKYGENWVFDFLYISYLIGLTGLLLFFNVAIIGRIAEMFTSSLFLLIALNILYSKNKIVDIMIGSFGIIYFIISNYRLIT